MKVARQRVTSVHAGTIQCGADQVLKNVHDRANCLKKGRMYTSRQATTGFLGSTVSSQVSLAHPRGCLGQAMRAPDVDDAAFRDRDAGAEEGRDAGADEGRRKRKPLEMARDDSEALWRIFCVSLRAFGSGAISGCNLGPGAVCGRDEDLIGGASSRATLAVSAAGHTFPCDPRFGAER